MKKKRRKRLARCQDTPTDISGGLVGGWITHFKAHESSRALFASAGHENNEKWLKLTVEYQHCQHLPMLVLKRCLLALFRSVSWPAGAKRERIFIELMTSDRKLKASREGSK